MQKIRIGNDIRLNLTLRGPRTYDQASIKKLACYLINTSVADFYTGETCCNDSHMYGHPCFNRCGCPQYHVYPHCCRPYHHDCRLSGRGCNPCAGAPCIPPAYCKPFDRVLAGYDDKFCYTAYSKVLPKANSIQCYFPAKDQLFCGVYKLVVVAEMYEPGWGKTDLHTYTMDYGEVLMLVNDNTGASGDITLDVDKDDILNKNIIDIRVKTHDLYLYGGNQIRLGEQDKKDHYYIIEVELENGSVLEYTPGNWPYEKLQFVATKSSVISIEEETGIIRAINQENTNSTYVTVKAKNNDITTGFNVTVVGGDYDYIGYLPVRPFAANVEDDTEVGFNRTDQSYEDNSQEHYTATGVEAVNTDDLKRVDDLTKPVQVENTRDGQYLWIVTRRPIAYAANITDNGTTDLNSAIYVPLTKYQQKLNDSKYYYCCPNPMSANTKSGGDIFYIKLEA